MMQHPYFRAPAKSTGREEFGTHLLDRFVADARSIKVVDHDLLATVTALTARSIADAFRRYHFSARPRRSSSSPAAARRTHPVR